MFKYIAEEKQCMTDEDLSELSEIIVKAYSQGLITRRGEPRNESENAWSIHKSIYFAATIVSTIGNFVNKNKLLNLC